MKWFRFYHASYRNPKVQNMRPELFKFWINMLCVANESEPRGTIPSEDHLRLALGLSKAVARRYCRELEALVLLHRSDTGALTPHDWHALQRDSDDSAKRQSDLRARSSGKRPPEMSRDMSRDKFGTVALPDTDTDTERDSEGVSESRPRAREGSDLKDWEEALKELQGRDDLRGIAAMLADSAEVPSVADLEAWRFIHAAHVGQGHQGSVTWNWYMTVARNATRKAFDKWHDPPVEHDPAFPAPARNGPAPRPMSEAQAKRERARQWAREA